MSKHVRLDGQRVAEVFDAAPDLHPLLQQFVHDDAPDDVAEGWTFDGTSYAPPAPPVVTKADLLDYCANRRWEIETGGMTVLGTAIATDDRSKSLINGTKAYLDANPIETVRFKSEAGWISVDLGAITAIFNALGAHIQNCFAAEEAIGLRIQSGELTTEAAVGSALEAEIAAGAA